MRRTGTGSMAFCRHAVWLLSSVLPPAVAPSFAEVPDCLVVEARTAPSADGKFDHSLTFVNHCDVRMRVTARYSDAAEDAGGSTVAAGERATIVLGLSRPGQGFRARYDVRFSGGSMVPSGKGAATEAAAPRAARSGDRLGPLGAAASPGGSLSLVALCDRALRRIFELEGRPETDGALTERVANCPSRVNRDPQRRRAELECVLGASTGGDLRACFGAR